MKRGFCLLVLLICTAVSCGCGSSGDTATSYISVPAQPTPTPTPTSIIFEKNYGGSGSEIVAMKSFSVIFPRGCVSFRAVP